jgi:hypothetical protein
VCGYRYCGNVSCLPPNREGQLLFSVMVLRGSPRKHKESVYGREE